MRLPYSHYAGYINQFLTIQVDPFMGLAGCSLYQYNIGKQSRSRIHFRPQKLGSVVDAQGAAYRSNGLDRQGYES
jgi:hypothetical protein